MTVVGCALRLSNDDTVLYSDEEDAAVFGALDERDSLLPLGVDPLGKYAVLTHIRRVWGQPHC